MDFSSTIRKLVCIQLFAFTHYSSWLFFYYFDKASLFGVGCPHRWFTTINGYALLTLVCPLLYRSSNFTVTRDPEQLHSSFLGQIVAILEKFSLHRHALLSFSALHSSTASLLYSKLKGDNYNCHLSWYYSGEPGQGDNYLLNFPSPVHRCFASTPLLDPYVCFL